MSDNKKIIVSLKPLPAKSYENLDLDRLAVYALCVLEQKKIPLYFDYASVALFRLFPKKFSMANFSRYPDTNRISKALRRLTDQKRKSWATGTIENAFSLTNLGREVGKQVLGILTNPERQEGARISAPTRSRGKSAAVEIHDLRNSDTFKKWQDKESINNYEFFAFLKAASYTPKPLLSNHLMRLKDSASTVGDKEVLTFLQWTEEKFKSLLN